MAKSTVGGYDYVFITDLPEDLVCTLCHLAFKNPLQIEECGHIFCKLCFDQMVEHAESNSLDITCPLDRQKIDVSRVFKDKSDERKVLNLIVQCQNFGDNCQWTGELREALEHKNQCCKNITMLDKPLDDKLNQLLNQVRELDTNSKRHELKLVEKDREIENLVKQMEDQSKQIDNLVKEVKNLHQCQNNMIMQNIEDETNFYPICTTFQWQFKPTEIKSVVKFSPPFYNSINPHCFQLGVYFLTNEFRLALFRYRGKYDHPSNPIKLTKDFVFEVRIFGKNGKLKVLKSYVGDYPILNDQVRSRGKHNTINNGEIGSLTNDNGYVTLHCSFNKID